MILLVSLLFVHQPQGGERKGQHAFPIGHFRLANGLLVPVDRHRAGDQGSEQAVATVVFLAFHSQHSQRWVAEIEPVMGAAQMNGQFPFAGEVLPVQGNGAAKSNGGR